MKPEWRQVEADLLSGYAPGPIYERSVHSAAGSLFGIVKTKAGKRLLVVEEQSSPLFAAIAADATSFISGRRTKEALLTPVNAAILRAYLPFMAPVAFGRAGLSLGLGDRLGLASPGHVRAVRDTGIRPVLAQQSIRELNLTGRTYEDVLAAAAWGVLEEGFHDGFAADGDHLKKREEITMALGQGLSMITLDCSEYITGGADSWTETQLEGAFAALPADYREQLESLYKDKTFGIGEYSIVFPRDELRRIAVIYGKAILYCRSVYQELIGPHGQSVDFEVSIDETATPTSPAAHYFVAAELERYGVKITSLAPRFCGEFQKGIDYIGDKRQFEHEFAMHAAIADNFGYRLSIHSGSDKLSVYPIIGRYTKGRVHVKTAGTNWLEALKVISRAAPALFRELYAFAVAFFPEARQYYHVTTNPANFQDLAKVTDEELPGILAEPDSRQLLHITYGGMLLTKAGERDMFRGRIYHALWEYEAEYTQELKAHIGAHIAALTGG